MAFSLKTLLIKCSYLFLLQLLIVKINANELYSTAITAIVGDLVIVELPFENNVTGRFLIDSGSNASFIDPDFVPKIQKNHLKRMENKDKEISTFNNKIKSHAYHLNWQLGQKKYTNILAYTNNLKRFNLKQDGIDCCDGIIGANLLKLAPFKVDLNNKKIHILKEFKIHGLYKKLDIQLVGLDIPVITCQSNQSGPIKLRLDSGSEIPLILQPSFIKKHFIQEKIFAINPKLSNFILVDMGHLSCPNIKAVQSNALLYTSNAGALAHDFIDGNLGARFLGRDYIFDFQQNAIYLKDSEREDSITLDIDKTHKINFNDTKIKNKAQSILLQADSLMLNSCSNESSINSCFIKKCLIHGHDSCNLPKKGTSLIKSIQFITQTTTADRLCPLTQLHNDLIAHPLLHSFCWWMASMQHSPWNGKPHIRQEFWDSRKKYIHPPLPIDSKITINYSSNPVTFTQQFYCYYIFSNIITYEQMPANLFAFSLKGVSLSDKLTSEYTKWFTTSAGKSCQEYLLNALDISPEKSLVPLFKNKTSYYIEINPMTILANGASDENFNREIKTTLNHERLHIIYAHHDHIQKKVKQKWHGLSKEKQQEFLKSHPSYNFSIEDVIYREYFSYGLEDNPEKVDDFLNTNSM